MILAAPPRMTEAEFLAKHGGELNVDLIDGQVVRYSRPGNAHGRLCLHAAFEVELFAEQSGLGRGFSNDTFVRIRDGTLRGADVCFWSYAKLPRETPLTDGVGNVPPELVVEVRSPTDRGTDLMGKAIDYIDAGVQVVVVLDPKTESASVFRSDTRHETFEKDATLTIPDVLPGFAVPVARFFAP